VLEHARELARVQTAAASAQAAVARLEAAVSALRGELRSRDGEIIELKRARIHAGAADVEEPADCGGGAGGGGGNSGGGGGGGGGGSGSASASGLQQLQASHQALRQVKQEKADVGEELADGEL
jgi:hypothetical protein